MELRTIPILATILIASAVGFKTAVPDQPAPPNIVLILVDDLGWADLPAYGHAFHETPHIDRLAREGMRFTDAYAAAPVCSPTRASIQAGQYPARVGITDFIPGHWRPYERLTVPENRTTSFLRRQESIEGSPEHYRSQMDPSPRRRRSGPG